MTIVGDRLALRSCRIFETWDLDDAEDQISKIMQPHRLLRDAGDEKSRSHMDFLKLCDVGIGTIAFGRGKVLVPPLDDYHLIVFCLTGGARLRVGTEEVDIDQRRGAACPPNVPLSGEFSADCEQLVVRIARRRLAQFQGHEVELSTRIDLAAERIQPFLSSLMHLISDPALVRLIQRDPQVAADYEHLLLRLLLAGHEAKRGTAKAASVHRVTRFIDANFAASLTLTDLAAVSGVAERTLHEAFCRFEGVSPMRYLRNVRLDHVHRQLARRGQTDTVTALATAAGFTHLGRFSQAYQQRFGYPPSATSRPAGWQGVTMTSREISPAPGE